MYFFLLELWRRWPLWPVRDTCGALSVCLTAQKKSTSTSGSASFPVSSSGCSIGLGVMAGGAVLWSLFSVENRSFFGAGGDISTGRPREGGGVACLPVV